MSYWDNFEEVSPSDYWGQFEETETQSPSAPAETPGQKAWNSFKEDIADLTYAPRKALSGATFGASDWALRKLGFTDDDYLARREAEGLGGAVKLAGMGAELGGNMLGAGGMLVKGLAKGGGLAASRLGQAIKYKGLENMPLAIATGTIEGGIQNSFDRDSLGWDTVGGAIEGAIGGSLGYGAGKLLGKGIVGAKRLKSKPSEDVRLLSGLRKDLGKVSGNQQYADELIDSALLDATRQRKSIIEVADDSIVDLAQGLRQQTPEAGFLLKNRLDLAKEAQPKAMRNFVDETLGTATRGDSVAAVAEKARQEAQPIYRRLENMGDLERYEIRGKLDNIAPDKYQPFTPQTGLSADEYADIVKQQAKKAGLNITEGNPELKNSGAKHFVIDEHGKIMNRGPFVGSLADTVNNPSIKVTKGEFTRSARPINDITTGKNLFDFVVQKGDELYTKMPTDKKYLAGQLKRPFDNLSVEGDLLSDMGIGPSVSGNINISKIGKLVNENDVIKDAIKSVKRAYSSLKNLPDTDFRVMNEARSLLSEQTLAPNTTLAYQAKAALRELDPIIDEVIPDYKIARGIYENAHKFEEASKLSKDVFSNNKNPSDFQNAVSKLSSREKDALAIG